MLHKIIWDGLDLIGLALAGVWFIIIVSVIITSSIRRKIKKRKESK